MVLALFKTNPDTGALPKLRDVSPLYAELTQRRDDLIAEREALRRETISLGRLLDAGRDKGTPGQKEKEARVAELLGETAPATELPDRERYTKILRRINDIATALALLEKRISTERLRASAIIRDQIAGRHKQLVAAVCQAMVGLHQASAAYHRFADELNADQVAWSNLLPMQVQWLGSPRGSNGPVARYLHEAMQKEFISPGLIPEELRR